MEKYVVSVSMEDIPVSCIPFMMTMLSGEGYDWYVLSQNAQVSTMIHMSMTQEDCGDIERGKLI
jgi:hypothetical protein